MTFRPLAAQTGGDDSGSSAEGAGATVEFRDVSKTYSATRGYAPAPAVRDLSLAIGSGELCTFVGPSGCGKTTTLKMVNRLIVPTSGQILVDGEDVAAQDPVLLRRRIGYVIQQVGLFPHLTIAENVATVPRLLGWADSRIRSRVDELLALVSLDPSRTRERYPSELSGGERQRVGVARAIAAEPPLLLMDEPFGAVDPIVRERLQDELLELHRRLGVTVIFVTHDVDEAIKLGTRVAVFARGGRLVQYDSPAEILAHPANEDVARFVGQDRLLKRLGLVKVGDLPLDPPASDGSEDPAVYPETSARDALAAILASQRQEVRVVGAADETLGVLTLSQVAGLMRAIVPTAGSATDPTSCTSEGGAEEP